MLATLFIGITSFHSVLSSSLSPSEKAESDAVVLIHAAELEVGAVVSVEGFWFLSKQGTDPKQIYLLSARAPKRQCHIQFVNTEKHYKTSERIPFNNKPHFFEPCDGGIWLLNGKLVAGTGHPLESDMAKSSFIVKANGDILFKRTSVF